MHTINYREEGRYNLTLSAHHRRRRRRRFLLFLRLGIRGWMEPRGRGNKEGSGGWLRDAPGFGSVKRTRSVYPNQACFMGQAQSPDSSRPNLDRIRAQLENWANVLLGKICLNWVGVLRLEWRIIS